MESVMTLRNGVSSLDACIDDAKKRSALLSNSASAFTEQLNDELCYARAVLSTISDLESEAKAAAASGTHRASDPPPRGNRLVSSPGRPTGQASPPAATAASVSVASAPVSSADGPRIDARVNASAMTPQVRRPNPTRTPEK